MRRQRSSSRPAAALCQSSNTSRSEPEGDVPHYYIYRYSSARVEARSSTGVIRKPPPEFAHVSLAVRRSGVSNQEVAENDTARIGRSF
jgi:hypothetical protein